MKRLFSISAACLGIVAVVALAGCGGGSSGSAIPASPITPISATTPGGVSLAQGISFTSGTPQAISISELGYTGLFTAKSSNSAVVSVGIVNHQLRSAQARLPQDTSATITLTPVGGGNATVTISDSIGNSISGTVNVSSLTFTPQTHSQGDK